ncbi:hypothetical protein AMECASPLE_038683 [Ameca splendens]|uniref:Uncharacterized protein n=1 Tax=Ameca splendens TaxID=208324 RepID=A0ABV0XXB7_9TELE
MALPPCVRGGQPQLTLHLMEASGSPVKRLRGSSLHRHVGMVHNSLSFSLSLSPHILPHVKSLARQKQLLQHPAASIPPSLPREQQSYPAQHRVGDATASSAFRREITEGWSIKERGAKRKICFSLEDGNCP